MPRIYKGNEVTMKLLVHKCVFGEISDLKIALYTTNPDNAIEFTDRYTIDGNIATLIVPNYAFGTMEDGVINYVAQGIKDGEPFCTNRQSNYFLKTPTDYVPTPMPDEIKIQTIKLEALLPREEGQSTLYEINPDNGYDGIKKVMVTTDVLQQTRYNEGYEQGYEQGKAEGGGSGDCNIQSVETELGFGDGWIRRASDYGLDGISEITIDGRKNNHYQKSIMMYEAYQGEGGGYNGFALGANNLVWITNYTPTIDTNIEIWVRPSEDISRPWAGFIGSQNFDEDNSSTFQIRRDGSDNAFRFNFGEAVFSYDYVPNTWYRLKMNRHGVWVNGEQVCEWGVNDFVAANQPLIINGIYNPDWYNASDLFRAAKAEYGYIAIDETHLLVPYTNGSFICDTEIGITSRPYGSDAEIWAAEYYEGMGSTSSVNCDEAYNDGYNDGYNQGKSECSESGECPEINLEDKWVTPSYNEKDDNGLIVVNPSEGFDGLSRVVLDPQQIYNEGVEEGRNQGGGEGGGDAELGVLDVTLGEPYAQSFDAKERDGLDGYFVVVVRPEELVERERNNAVEDFKNKMDSITITENGSYGIDHLTNYPYLDYENVNGYAEFHYTPNDDNFEIEVSYSLGENAVMHLVDIGEYSVEFTAGMCYGAKNDERISPEHMSWGIEDKTIHTIKVTREGITLLDDGSFISWGEDLGTISSNIKVGRDFTSKIFTVKINGETFTPEGDGVFTNSFAIGEAARYGELQTSDYPNGFRNVEVNVPSVRDVITQYRHNPITVGDIASGLRGDFLNIGWSGMISENDDWVYDGLLLRGSFKNNNHRIYTTQKVKSIENDFIFTEGREYIQNIVFDDNILSITLSDIELVQLKEIVFGEFVSNITFINCNFHSLEKIVLKRNVPLSQTAFNLENTTVAENGTLYVPEGYENADGILSSLPSGWTTQYI